MEILSLHTLAEIDQQLVTGFEADQTRAWVLHVQHDVDDDNREDCEAEDVKPTPVLAARHSIPCQKRTDEPQAEQQNINDSRRVDL